MSGLDNLSNITNTSNTTNITGTPVVIADQRLGPQALQGFEAYLYLAYTCTLVKTIFNIRFHTLTLM